MPPSHEFSIPVTSLDAAGRSYRFPVRAAWMKEVLEGHDAEASSQDGDLDVRLSKSGNDVVVYGTLKAELVAPCARCLEPVKIPVNQVVSALMVPAAQLKSTAGDDYEFAQDEAETHPYDGDTVVLDDLVRDELLLGAPSHGSVIRQLDVSADAEPEIFEAALRCERERARLGFRFEAQIDTVFARLVEDHSKRGGGTRLVLAAARDRRHRTT
jgi:uncharacterized protein